MRVGGHRQVCTLPILTGMFPHEEALDRRFSVGAVRERVARKCVGEAVREKPTVTKAVTGYAVDGGYSAVL